MWRETGVAGDNSSDFWGVVREGSGSGSFASIAVMPFTGVNRLPSALIGVVRDPSTVLIGVLKTKSSTFFFGVLNLGEVSETSAFFCSAPRSGVSWVSSAPAAASSVAAVSSWVWWPSIASNSGEG